MKNKTLALTVSFIVISGCSTNFKIKEREYVDFNSDVIANELKLSSEAISDAMLILARNDNALKSELLTAEQVRTENAKAVFVPSGMEKKTSFRWNGPAVTALASMARYSGYEFVVSGKRPVRALEPNVYLDEENKQVIDIIRLVEAATKDRLSITIRDYQNIKMMEVRYVGNQ